MDSCPTYSDAINLVIPMTIVELGEKDHIIIYIYYPSGFEKLNNPDFVYSVVKIICLCLSHNRANTKTEMVLLCLLEGVEL